MSGLFLLLLLLLPLLLLDSVLSVSFYLPVNSRKCLKEDIRRNVLLSGEYEVSESRDTRTDLKITDSFGATLYNKENASKGKFSFVTENHDQFEVCFHRRIRMDVGSVPDQLVTLNIKRGVEAKNHTEVDKVEKLTPLEAQLAHLERLSKAIADDFTNAKERGKEMRQTNKSTNEKVMLFSFVSIGSFLALATWQVFYLRRFFKTKKLIE